MSGYRNKNQKQKVSADSKLEFSLTEGNKNRIVTLHGCNITAARDFLNHSAALEESNWQDTLRQACSYKIENKVIIPANRSASKALRLDTVKFFRKEASFRQVLNTFFPKNTGSEIVENIREIIHTDFKKEFTPLVGRKNLQINVRINPELQNLFGSYASFEISVPNGIIAEETRISLPTGELILRHDPHLDYDYLVSKYEIDENTIKCWLNGVDLHSDPESIKFLRDSGAANDPLFELALTWRLGGYINGFCRLNHAIRERMNENDLEKLCGFEQ